MRFQDSSWETAKTFGVLSGIAAGFIAISIWGWACCRIMSDQTIGKVFVYLSTFACFASGMVSFKSIKGKHAKMMRTYVFLNIDVYFCKQ